MVTDEMSKTELIVFGICIYTSETIVRSDKTRQPLGFIQYPTEAPSDVVDKEYYPEEY